MEWNRGFCGGSSYKSKSIIILSGLSQNASLVISIRGSGHRDQFAPLGCQLLCLAYAHHRHHTLIHISILVYLSNNSLSRYLGYGSDPVWHPVAILLWRPDACWWALHWLAAAHQPVMRESQLAPPLVSSHFSSSLIPPTSPFLLLRLVNSHPHI